MRDFQIIIGKGLKNISFGNGLIDIIKVLGKPDKIEDYEFSDKTKARNLQYFDLDISLTLSSDYDYRLTDILIYNPKFHIYNEIHTGISKQIALSLAIKYKFGKCIFKKYENDESPTYELAQFNKISVFFWFDNDVLSTIQIGPLWLDKNKIKWPK